MLVCMFYLSECHRRGRKWKKRNSMVSVSRIGSENGRKNGANPCLKEIDQIILLSLF